jgi:hypothetical protein
LGKAQDAIKDAVGTTELSIDGQVRVGMKRTSGKGEPARRIVPLSDAYRAKKT